MMLVSRHSSLNRQNSLFWRRHVKDQTVSDYFQFVSIGMINVNCECYCLFCFKFVLFMFICFILLSINIDSCFDQCEQTEQYEGILTLLYLLFLLLENFSLCFSLFFFLFIFVIAFPYPDVQCESVQSENGKLFRISFCIKKNTASIIDACFICLLPVCAECLCFFVCFYFMFRNCC